MKQTPLPNLRSYVLTTDEQDSDFSPFDFVRRLKEAGFVFEHEGCPFILRTPWNRRDRPDGSVLWLQWDVPDVSAAIAALKRVDYANLSLYDAQLLDTALYALCADFVPQTEHGKLLTTTSAARPAAARNSRRTPGS